MKLLLDENRSRRLLPLLESNLAALLSHRESIDERFADDAVALVELTATTFPPSA